MRLGCWVLTSIAPKSVDGVKHKLNDVLLPAENPGQMFGTTYQFSDAVDQGQHYYYWLELIGIERTELIEPEVVNTDYWVILPTILR